jgi:hypothetical protein
VRLHPYDKICTVIFLETEPVQSREDYSPIAPVRPKRATQLISPAELRKHFNLNEGDNPEAEAVDNDILQVAAPCERSLRSVP